MQNGMKKFDINGLILQAYPESLILDLSVDKMIDDKIYISKNYMESSMCPNIAKWAGKMQVMYHLYLVIIVNHGGLEMLYS